MNSKHYIEQAKKTEHESYELPKVRLIQPGVARILHAAMGVSTESAEILDAVKKHIFYGKTLDKVNLFEEAGDIFWYLAILADELGFDFEDAMDTNIKKLKVSYENGFTENRAITRNLNNERTELEKGKLS
jgi:NTP pyrophosphatase (non-canonical NTP hydrolase)